MLNFGGWLRSAQLTHGIAATDPQVTMKKVDFTESQIVKILCEARLTSVNEAARKHSITEATIYAWHGKFGRLGAEDVKRLRHLKNEHARRQRSSAKDSN